MDEPLVTFFVTKEKFFKNSRRTFLITDKSLVSLEHGQDTKLEIAFREIQGLGPGSKPTTMTLKVPQGTDTYICDSPNRRDSTLSVLYDFRRRLARKGESKRLQMLQYKPYTGEELETSVVISNVDIAKFDGEREYSSKLLKDLQTIFLVEKEKDSFVLSFSDDSKSCYRCQGEAAAAVVNLIKNMYQKFYGGNIPVKTAALEALMPPVPDLSPEERLFGFPIKKYSRRYDTMLDRVMCFTSTSICLCEGSRVVSKHPLRDITAVHTYGDNPEQLSIDFAKSSKIGPAIYYSTGRDTIIANLMAITRSGPEPVNYDLSGTHPLFYIRPSITRGLAVIDPEAQEYFLRRIAKLTIKNDNLAVVLKEFNTYISFDGVLNNKDRRGMEHMFEMVHYLNLMYEKGNHALEPIIVDIFQVIQRLLTSKLNYAEIKLVKDFVRIISDGIRSSSELISASACGTSLAILEQPKQFEAKSNRGEAVNKAALLTDEFFNATVSTLVQRTFDFENESTLQISGLLDILTSVMASHVHTTEKPWFNATLLKLGRGVTLNALFELCRSPCFAISLKASNLVKTILENTPQDVYVQVQEAARVQLALLYQLWQALDSRLSKQRKISGELVALMADGNETSLSLLKRIIPPRIIKILKQPVAAAPITVKGKIKKAATKSSSSRALDNWKALFKFLMQDVRRPDLYWGAETRRELSAAIDNEITLFDRDKLNNREKNKVWNFEEFSVRYHTYERELVVDEKYLGLILEQPENLELNNPRKFLIMLFHKLLMAVDPAHSDRIAQVMAWCFNRYPQQIGGLTYMENLVGALNLAVKDAEYNQDSDNAQMYDKYIESFLEFLNYSFSIPINPKMFIDYNGLSIAAQVLRGIHKPPLEQSYSRALVCLDVLNKATRLVDSVDERGFIKIPVPRAKRELASSPDILPCIAQALMAKSAEVVGKAAILLDRLLDNNSAVTSELHLRTGILFFILGNDGEPSPALMKLLQTIAAQQDHHLLRQYVPDSIATYLETADPTEFAQVFQGQSVSAAEVIWTPNMRNILLNAVGAHLADFKQTLEANPYAMYTYQEMPPVEYPGLDQELRCGGYYIRNVVEYPESNIECPEEVLRDALKMMNHVEKPEKALLLKGCAVLYKKYHKLHPFRKFGGFPIVLAFLDLDRSNPDLSPESLQLVLASIETIFFSVWASRQNLAAFLKQKGMSHLGTLLWCCSRNINEPGCYSILTFVFRIVIRLIASPKAREHVATDSDIIRDILSCLTVGQPPEIVSLAMQSVMDFSQEGSLAEFVYKQGAHIYLLDFILSYVPDVSDEEDSPEKVLNELAVRACMVLGTISGVYSQTGQPGNHTEAKYQHALSQLLTKGMLNHMRNCQESDFLRLLCRSYETPFSIWNEATRNELAGYVRHRISELQGGQEELGEPSFSFDTHRQELQVHGIFVRVYNQHPAVPLENPRDFLTQLLGHLYQSRSDPAAVEMLLGAMYNVLNSKQGIEKIVTAPDALNVLFDILMAPETAEEQRALVLGVLLQTTANQLCVDVVCSLQTLHHFLVLLHSYPSLRKLTLDCLLNMVSCSSKAVTGVVQSGLLLVLLNIASDHSDPESRSQAISVLKQTKVAATAGPPSFSDIVGLFWPAYLVAVLERPLPEFLYFYDHDIVRADIIWDDMNRQASAACVAEELQRFVGSGQLQWDPASSGFVDFVAVNDQFSIGGVNINIYNEQPQQQLHNPRLFLQELLATIAETDDPDMHGACISALNSLLTNSPSWVHLLAQQPVPVLQKIANIMNDTEFLQLQQVLVGIFGMAAHSPNCIKALTGVTLMPALDCALQLNANDAAVKERVARTQYLLVRKDPAFIKQVLDFSAYQGLLAGLSDNGNFGKIASAVLKIMAFDRRHGAQARQALAGNEHLWQQEGMPKIKAEWLQLPSLSNPNALYIAPIEADAAARDAAVVTKSTVISTAVAEQSTPQKMQPLSRAHELPASYKEAPSPVPQAAPAQKQVELEQLQEQQAQYYAQMHAAAQANAAEHVQSMPAAPLVEGEVRGPPPAPPPKDGSGPPPPPPPPPAGGIPASTPGAPPSANLGPAPAARPPAALPSGAPVDLLASIRQGVDLKKAQTLTPEERKEQMAVAAPGGGSIMDALAGALAARRQKLVTNLAANPFENDGSDSEEDDEEDWE